MKAKIQRVGSTQSYVGVNTPTLLQTPVIRSSKIAKEYNHDDNFIGFFGKYRDGFETKKATRK